MTEQQGNKNAAPGGIAEDGSFEGLADNAISTPLTQAGASPEARTLTRQEWVQAELFPGRWPSVENAE